MKYLSFFSRKEIFFKQLLSETKFELLPCRGSYFQCVSFQNISNEKDTDFAEKLVTDFGVAAIPVSAFYSKNVDNKVLRFCFAKENSTLEKAVEKLTKL